jgi:hypothetical protein
MVLTGFSISFMTNTATLLSRPWSLSSAGTALHYEQHPLRGPSAILLWLFSLVCYYGIPSCLSVWRRDWWNVGKFLQWFLFDFSKSLFTFDFLRSLLISSVILAYQFPPFNVRFRFYDPDATRSATGGYFLFLHRGQGSSYWSWNSSSPTPSRFYKNKIPSQVPMP